MIQVGDAAQAAVAPRALQNSFMTTVPKAPCTHIVYISALKYLYRDPFKA